MGECRIETHVQSRRRLYRAILASAIILVVIFCVGSLAMAGDPSGARTGNSSDVKIDSKAKPSDQGSALLDEVGHTRISLNFVWLFLGAILVFFMQAGFALLETGLCQKKNALHVMMTNFMIFGIAVIGFYILGFAIMFGGFGPLVNFGGKAIDRKSVV